MLVEFLSHFSGHPVSTSELFKGKIIFCASKIEPRLTMLEPPATMIDGLIKQLYRFRDQKIVEFRQSLVDYRKSMDTLVSTMLLDFTRLLNRFSDGKRTELRRLLQSYRQGIHEFAPIAPEASSLVPIAEMIMHEQQLKSQLQLCEAVQRDVRFENLRAIAIPESLPDERDCPICLTEISNDQILTRLSCHENHIYHLGCLAELVQTHQQPRCPECRTTIGLNRQSLLLQKNRYLSQEELTQWERDLHTT